ncbi:MAG TPA: chemotaxis protein CheD [Geobacteraceae bacterium]
MKAANSDLPFVYLKPGELYIAESPTLVSTVLGSCVSVTMYSERARLGAICHALLPEGPVEDAFRYVDSSILYMLQQFTRLHIGRAQIQVKIFGGAGMLGAQDARAISVGRRNVVVARQVIKEEGLAIVAEDVGGLRGRKIFFRSDTGEVWLKRLARDEAFLSG